MAGQLVTVFGGTGFLGRAIVRQLAEAGKRVRVAARHPDAAGSDDKIEPFRADLRNPDDVASAVEGATAVLNAVSLYAEGGGVTFQDIHVDAAGLLASRAADAGVKRLVHVSGLAVTEHSPSSYVRSRALGEKRVLEAFPKATILRPSVIFGPNDAFLSTLRSVTRAPVVPLFGAGDTRLQPVHVDDVAAAAVKVAKSDGPAGRVYELGGPDVLTYREIVEMVMDHLGRHRWLVPMPFGAWHALAGTTAMLPSPPLTRDQVMLMETDNVVGETESTFADLGIEPVSLQASLGACFAA